MQPKLTKHVLENGLQIFFYKDKNKHTANFHLVVKFGGINGDFILDNQKYHIANGMAHLLEHLLLEHSQYGNLTHKLRKMNMSSNGVTNIYKTEFYFSTVENLEQGIEVMIKGINEPCFTSQDLDETKPAIYEEIRIGNDSKFKQLFNMRNKQLFKKIPYIDTAGEVKEVASFDYDLVTKTYQAFYRPNNQIILVAGNFDETKILNQIKKLYNQLPQNNHQVTIVNYDELDEINQKYVKEKFNTGQDIVTISYKINIKNLTPEQKLELDFYLIYFGQMNFSETSSLYNDLITRRIVNGLNCYHTFFNDTLVFSIEAFVKDEKQFTDKIIKAIKTPILDEELFNLYQKESKVGIATRFENLNKIIKPLIINITSFNYYKADSIEQINSYNFKRFKQMINSLNFDNYIISKIEK